jgi:hypothetical protein
MGTATINSQPAASKRQILPPEEQFWQRYSPNNEFPLSSVGSITIYLIIGVLLVACIKMKLFDTERPPLDVDAVEMDFTDIGGGGGDPEGMSGGVGQTMPDKISGVAKVNDNLPPLPALNLPKPKLDDSKLADLIPRDDQQDGAVANYTESMGRLADLEKEMQDKLLRSLGKGGSGSGGGKGGGVGTGTGDGKGPGSRAPLDERQKRVLRWNMVFDTRNGEDYRLQLQSLGAILAVPTAATAADGSVQYLVIRDLRGPLSRQKQPEVEDLRGIKRIFWVDNRPESVGPLAQALGLGNPPPLVVAFFPVELEDKLAQLEKNFAQSRGKAIPTIRETRFRIVLNGRTGKYEPMLVDQR